MDDGARIPLRRRDGSVRAWVRIDRDDIEWLSQWRWCLGNPGYAWRVEQQDGRQRAVLMHRQLLGLAHGDGLYGDHINGDKLDNRRANLRVATPGQSAQNIRACHGETSPHRGVRLDKRRGLWGAGAQIAGRYHWLGYHSTEQEAADAAAAFRREHMAYAVDR